MGAVHSMESAEAQAFTLSMPADVVEAVAQRAAELVVARLAASEDAWLDVEGAARHLACGRRRIYDLHSQRRIPAHKDGTRLLFRRSELDAYLDAA
ncbi:MAG TPA: helix-turn-helix domain-containing protein [Solirubrobacteraceae bacterium]|nr:helix-turn-helix domain-containing protein [Solirubrobacteraceae bacterium]